MPNEINETIATRLRDARHAAGLRIAHVAVALDTRTDTIYRWEQGRHEPDLATLCRLAALYGVRAGWLVDGVGPREDGETPWT